MGESLINVIFPTWPVIRNGSLNKVGGIEGGIESVISAVRRKSMVRSAIIQRVPEWVYGDVALTRVIRQVKCDAIKCG